VTLYLPYLDQQIKDRPAELRAEADRERQAMLVTGPRRSVRARLADWIYALAERIEGQPSRRVVQSQA
jgi:hypothetical protein